MHTPVEDQVRRDVPAKQNKTSRVIVIAAIVVIGILVIIGVIFARQWPFTRSAVQQALQQQVGGTVQIGNFRQLYFPSPGAVAENVTFQRGTGGAPPLINIRRLTIAGSYPGLLVRHVSTIRAEGLQVNIPPAEKGPAGASGPIQVGTANSGLSIGEVVADGAEIIFPVTGDQTHAEVYRIPKLSVRNVRDDQPYDFRSTVQIPQPAATVDVAGKFGPWQSGNAGQTRLSGSYSLRDLDLKEFDGVGGIVTSQGKFDGVLQHLQLQGSTDTPKFEVTHGAHPVQLATLYHAIVNGLNGDVELNPAIAHFAKTTIICIGTIAGDDKEKGKTAKLEMYSNHARIQDLLRLFANEKTPAMTGPIQFRAKITLPPDDRGFLDRVRLVGDFGISGAQYPNPDTQKNIDVLSARAQGKADQVEDADDKLGKDTYDPGRVLSGVKGHVVLANAVANLSNVTFDVPGAKAQLGGTYKLKTEQIDFQGFMTMETQLSKATTGVKSFLLKVIQPLTASKKKNNESVVSLKIGGTYHDPTYVVMPVAKK